MTSFTSQDEVAAALMAALGDHFPSSTANQDDQSRSEGLALWQPPLELAPGEGDFSSLHAALIQITAPAHGSLHSTVLCDSIRRQQVSFSAAANRTCCRLSLVYTCTYAACVCMCRRLLVSYLCSSLFSAVLKAWQRVCCCRQQRMHVCSNAC